MSETIVLRDHSQPCEHGFLWSHWVNMAKAKWWQGPDCLGGKEMTLRRLDDVTWLQVENDADTTSHPKSGPDMVW